MALQRLCAPGSDLPGLQWISTAECPGFESLDLQHFYRTGAVQAEVRDELGAELSWRDSDLFTRDLEEDNDGPTACKSLLHGSRQKFEWTSRFQLTGHTT